MPNHTLHLDNHQTRPSWFGGVVRRNFRLIVFDENMGGRLGDVVIPVLLQNEARSAQVVTKAAIVTGFALFWEEDIAEVGRVGRTQYLMLPSPSQRSHNVYGYFGPVTDIGGVPYEVLLFQVDRRPLGEETQEFKITHDGEGQSQDVAAEAATRRGSEES